ncbi:unnamed protein product [Thelazia callipaeda]|uniref:UBX domain-containing protein n=1 Tax=Thelazia callipaeda TaxID=103827 RepID=A0A0N5D443_THECL|nr:unnamed protein product [Thelazia callipaeda]
MSMLDQLQEMGFPLDLAYVLCGKNLADDQAVMFHAMRTNHEEFSESAEVLKPLTQEEKKEKLASLQHKLKEIKVRKEEEEKKEALEKEKRRRLEGKSMAKVEQERKDLEIKKLLEQKKREKQEEAEARKRVLEQIRLDREARKAAQEQRQQPQSASPNEVRDDSFCHIQVRLFDGSVIKEKFKSDEPLSHVRLWVEMNDKNLTMKGTPFTLMTPFPRKIFTEEDMEAPIKAHGLVPTANMVVTRFVP